MQLTNEAIQKLRGRDSLRMKNRLAYELGKSVQTIEKWIKANNSQLTLLQALIILEEETGIKRDKLVEQSENTYA